MEKWTLKNMVETVFEYKGFNCVVLAQRMGFRCGYVKIPKNHKYYKVDYEKIDADVHGGLTYGEQSKEYPIATEEDSYWIGFDCYSGHRETSNIITVIRVWHKV